MGLEQRGKCRFGDTHADIREEIARFADLNGYSAHHFADACCACGGSTFRLSLDENVGAAVRTCLACKHEHAVADSAEYLEYLEEAELETCVCVCDAEGFEICVGVSLYVDSSDVRWLYLGCRCVGCSLVGVYGDWKSEFNGYEKLLRQV